MFAQCLSTSVTLARAGVTSLIWPGCGPLTPCCFRTGRLHEPESGGLRAREVAAAAGAHATRRRRLRRCLRLPRQVTVAITVCTHQYSSSPCALTSTRHHRVTLCSRRVKCLRCCVVAGIYRVSWVATMATSMKVSSSGLSKLH